MKRAWLLVGAAVVACATAATVIGTSVAGDEILFPHALHKSKGVECIACHEGIWDAKSLVPTTYLPDEAKCLECHKAKKAEGKCEFCHADVRYAGPWPKREARLNIDHVAHLERTKEDCTVCHLRLNEPRHPAPVSGGHDACLKCHEHADQFADAACKTCHIDMSKYPLKPVVEMSHLGDFLRRHPTVARASSASCATCHDQNFCNDCHAQTAMVPIEVKLIDRPDRRFIHRQDFLGRHSVEAAADPDSCRRCHSTASCNDCHTLSHVGGGYSGSPNPHPPGWSLPGTGVQFHGDAARRDINSCAACHDQGAQSNCVGCHKVGGIGGDPHPASFQSRHTITEAAQDSRCAACHR
ncbi:MAG TPA: cytochrome c3 family protein [Myxococcales bacterium]|nr:cytochrome c3 family protein [Myxococcales bacterium]